MRFALVNQPVVIERLMIVEMSKRIIYACLLALAGATVVADRSVTPGESSEVSQTFEAGQPVGSS